MPSKMPLHTFQRKNRKESSHTVEKEQEFRMTHFPDRPLKRVAFKDIPGEADCRRILSGWKSGKMMPPKMYSSRRMSRIIERESECMGDVRPELQRRQYHENYEKQGLEQYIRVEPGSVPSSSRMAEHGFIDRIPPEHQHASEQVLLPRTTYNPQLESKATESLLKASHPSTPPPSTIYSRRSTRSSTPHRRSPPIPPSTCPLCHSYSRDNQGDLCSTCKSEFAMSFNDFCEDDESILCSSACLPSVEHLAPKELCGYSSSVYSSDTSSTDNNKLATSPQLLGDADNTISPVSSSSSMEDPCILGPDTRKLASHPSQYERTEMEEEYLDLYDRDWAEYYFDESNFTPKKDPWESLYKYVLVLHNTAQNK